MAAPGNKDKPESPETVGRRSSRIAIAIPITLSGKDEAGNAFKEKARTIVINKHGAKISTFHHLALGAEVTVENQLLGRSAKATVVWFGDRRSPRAPMEVGIQLKEAQNLWGIELPPEDWQEGPPIGPGGQKLEGAFAQKARPSASPTAEGGSGLAARMPAAAGAPPAKLEKRAEAALEERVRLLEEHLARLGEQPTTPPGSFTGSARQRVEEVLQSLDKRVDEVVGLFEAYRSDLGAFVARTDEIRRASQEEAERARSRIQSAASEALDRGVGGMREKIRSEVEAALQASHQKSAKDVQLRFEKLTEESLDGAVRELRKAAEEHSRALTAEVRSSRQTLLDEAKKSLQTMIREAMESFHKETKTFERDYPAQLAQKLKGYQDQRIHELETHLHQALEKERQAVLKQVQKVGEESTERAVEQLAAACEQVVKTQMEAAKDRIGEQSESAQTELRKELEGLLDQFHQQLQRTASGIQEESQKAATAKLQEVTDRLLDESAALLRKQADENMELVAHQLDEARARVVAQAEKTLRHPAGKPAPPPSEPAAGKSGQS